MRCEGRGDNSFLLPLHGEMSGPLRRPICIGKWDAEHGPRRRARRMLIKALRAYEAVGGRIFGPDFNVLKLAASGAFRGDAAVSDADFKDLTAELLTAAMALTPPDRHPAERKAEAQRVTQELVALKPFVFPAPKPEPPKPRDACSNQQRDAFNKPSQPDYPCEDCRDTVPSSIATPAKRNGTRNRKKNTSSRDRSAKRKTSGHANATVRSNTPVDRASRPICAITCPLAVSSWYSPTNS